VVEREEVRAEAIFNLMLSKMDVEVLRLLDASVRSMFLEMRSTMLYGLAQLFRVLRSSVPYCLSSQHTYESSKTEDYSS